MVQQRGTASHSLTHRLQQQSVVLVIGAGAANYQFIEKWANRDLPMLVSAHIFDLT